MALYREQGVVLRTYKLGESDRIIIFMTAGRGKVRAVGKGVRKTKSRFGGRLEPPNNVSLLLYEGRELDIVTQAESIDHFRPIRDDLGRMTDAMALLEAVDQVAQEGEANPRLYSMLVGALRALANDKSPLLVPAFFWKLLALEGHGPLLTQCAGCGESDVELVAFDLTEGGTLCRNCRRGLSITPEALALLRRLLGGELGRVLGEPESPATHEVSLLAIRSLENYLERRLKALHTLG
jgi:DNA repair protein RecO (recombination protein O)